MGGRPEGGLIVSQYRQCGDFYVSVYALVTDSHEIKAISDKAGIEESVSGLMVKRADGVEYAEVWYTTDREPWNINTEYCRVEGLAG